MKATQCGLLGITHVKMRARGGSGYETCRRRREPGTARFRQFTVRPGSPYVIPWAGVPPSPASLAKCRAVFRPVRPSNTARGIARGGEPSSLVWKGCAGPWGGVRRGRAWPHAAGER